MPQSDSGHRGSVIKTVNPLSVMRDGEETITTVTRSPIGIFVVFVAGGAFLILIGLIALLGVPAVFSHQTTSAQMAIGIALFGFSAVFVTLFLFLANKIYWDNYWVVTDDSITQVTRTSLFDKQASQLSLSNLEDVSTEQHGILATIFKFGTISAETAGATDKFFLNYCPHPDTYAKQILAAHENFLQSEGHHAKEPDGDEGTGSVDSYEVPM